jgi:membrane protease YdiL (CAAX protease family)
MSTVTLNQPQSGTSYLRRHPVTSFFVLTFAVTWALWAPLVILGDSASTGLAFVLALLGSLVPSTLAVVFVAVLHGRQGVRKFLSRLLKARIGLRWYLAVLALPLLAPLALGLSILFGGSKPPLDTTIFAVLFGFAFSIFPGSAVGEELGWRGFALPNLQRKHSALRASLVIGVLWGTWHMPLWLTGNETHPFKFYAPFAVTVVAVSVLCTWMYNSTGGSLLIVVLFHATANLPLTFLITPLKDEMTSSLLIYVGLMVIATTCVVIATGAANLSRTRTKQVDVP